jgi:hypothetical protein
MGDFYSFDFKPTSTGMYTFSDGGGGFANYENTNFTFATDDLSLASSVTITVEAAPAPEPASLTLLGIGVASLAGYASRRRR